MSDGVYLGEYVCLCIVCARITYIKSEYMNMAERSIYYIIIK